MMINLMPPPRVKAAARKSKLPDFFIVGAPKCGTTAMNQYLAAHPDIYMAKKEMHVFGTDLQFGSRFYRRDYRAYLAEFEDRCGQARAGEASVWYLFSRRAAAEIEAFNPQARVIVMLREPVEMLYSLYYHFRWDANEHLPTFEEALAAESDRRAGRRVSRPAYFAQGLVYRETARYTEQLERYFEVFGRERVHVIIYDDFAAHTAGVYQDTLAFLGLEAPKAPIGFKPVNENKYAKKSLLGALLNDPLLRSTAYRMHAWLPRRWFRALQNVEVRLRRCHTRVAHRPPLAPEVRTRLKRELAPEVEKLSELLGRDLTYWSE